MKHRVWVCVWTISAFHKGLVPLPPSDELFPRTLVFPGLCVELLSASLVTLLQLINCSLLPTCSYLLQDTIGFIDLSLKFKMTIKSSQLITFYMPLPVVFTLFNQMGYLGKHHFLDSIIAHHTEHLFNLFKNATWYFKQGLAPLASKLHMQTLLAS